MVKTLAILLLAGVLAGCATRPQFLENRAVCTVSKEKAFIVSQWGPVGVTAEIAQADAEVICKSESH